MRCNGENLPRPLPHSPKAHPTPPKDKSAKRPATWTEGQEIPENLPSLTLLVLGGGQ